MSKKKKPRKPNSDEISAKKSASTNSTNPFAKRGATAQASKRVNPFEIHVNKEKFHILGRTCKHDKGLPGVSRGKAAKKRRETLGQEYREQNKRNKFKDRRIGKNDTGSEFSQQVLDARFAAEKMSQFKQSKLSRFNLNDDELLTHRGQTLEDIQQFCDDRSDDDYDEEDALDAKFTEAAHFGGDATDQSDRKTVIEDMILETKRRKAEVAKDKDEVHDLTLKLDANYKQIAGLVNKLSNKDDLRTKPPTDDYDKIMREMIFEPRGEVTDKLMSEEELAKKEKDRLEKLESERLKRMRADGETVEEDQTATHRSADALDDGYFANTEIDDEGGTLTYNLDGELLGNSNGTESETSEVEDNDKTDLESSNSEVSGSENDGEEVEEENSENSLESGNEEENDGDNLSDLKSSDSEDDFENVIGAGIIKQPSKDKTQMKANLNPTAVNDKPNNELPFIVDMPSSYPEFRELVKTHSAKDQATLVQRLIKCHHPTLDAVNREKVVQIFSFLVQYIVELFADASSEDVALNFRILAGLSPLLYDLLHLNTEKMSLILLSEIQQKYTKFIKTPKSYPGLETFVLLKLISNLFSTSDFRHPVVTPCFVFAEHILARARVRTRQDIAMGLFLVTILLECTQQSHRFFPGVFNYLLGIIFLAIPKRPVEILKIMPPFHSTGPLSKTLAIETSVEEVYTEQLMNSEDLVTTTLTTSFKVRALNTALKLIVDGIGIARENIGANYVAASLLEMLDRLPLEPYPEYVKKNFMKTKETLESAAAKLLTKLVAPESKPKSLRLLEPRIEPVYDDKRRPKMTKEKEERAKLLHRFKRERKGAMREIRRDTDFLQKIRIKEQIQSDLERKEKVKRIFHEASMQQGELNELARAKKRKKF